VSSLRSRALALVVALSVLGAGTAVVAGDLTGKTTTAAVSSPTPTAVDSHASATDRLECTNATSEAILACGPTDGPASVALSEQSSNGGSVVVDAVEFEEGGFVALHRVSYVDGAFTESVVGVSGYHESGLHRDVPVQLRESLDRDSDHRLIAVAYRDSDADESFDFVTTDGDADRPYTNTYTESGGNVTDEAGDVLGDHAVVSLTSAPTVDGRTPTSVDGDPMLEDIDGDGEVTLFDAMSYYNNRNSAVIQNNPGLFDFDGDGESGTLFDAIALYDDRS
jgi:hypothetical protein